MCLLARSFWGYSSTVVVLGDCVEKNQLMLPFIQSAGYKCALVGLQSCET